ncbi:unnamed protein product [Mytilus coruscus]|uniref:B box-type domain-containing protein n=1 Tax=Mytilus coruscus TaxID=42192 RepID=A0A6J8A834_MYTCO|nr:unnamed protein product [Mytilus coruscus]
MKGEKFEIITGITKSDNDTLIVCDVAKRTVYFYDETDTYLSSITSPDKPWDVAAIRGTTTAVMSSRFEPNIYFINIERRTKSSPIEVKQIGGYGVAATKDNIFVGTKEMIKVLDLRGNLIRTISLKETECTVSYVSVFSNGNICYTIGDKICCITSDGDLVFSYASPELHDARNIEIDDAGNIYVLGRYSQNLHQLTSTGTFVNILLKKTLSEPLAFCFSKDFSKVYIADKCGKSISVFKTNKFTKVFKLPGRHFVKEIISSRNMTSNYCEPCTARGMTPTASKWCTECEEALCFDCTEVHRVQKMSRNHHLVEIGKIPEKVNLSHNCSKHQHLPFDYFCVDHDVICCKECWPKNHQTCKNVTSIDIASKNSKQSQSFLDSEEQLRFILEALKKLSKNCKDNGSRINKEETQILKQIKTMKENVIKQLEALEESLLKQLTEKKDKYVTSLKRQEKRIGDLVNSTKAQKESLEFVRDHGSEKQAFVSIHSSKPVLDEIENKVKQLTESFADTSLTFVESGSKEKLADLGSIEIKETPCFSPFVPYKQQQSQVPVVPKRQIYSFTHIYDIDVKGEKLEGVTGITVSDNNTLIFCDVNTSKVYFCDENDSYQSSIISPYQPWDISAIPGTMTAVMSSRYEPFIQFVAIKRRRISKEIAVELSNCFGIDATKDNIFIGPRENIQVLDLSGNIQRTVKDKYGQDNSGYILVCPNGNICYSSGNAVHCITLDERHHVFSYKSSDLLYPRKMITDDAENIYVLDCRSQSIHKLSSTGTLVDTLSMDRCSNPYTFCFSKDLSKCYIANRYGTTISVFKTN